MLLPLKMSRLPWESIISEAIMSFTAHEERRGKSLGGTVPEAVKKNKYHTPTRLHGRE